MKFEKDYFENYYIEGKKSYQEVYHAFTKIQDFINVIRKPSVTKTWVKSVSFLGTGTGEVLLDFKSDFPDVEIHGCEISKYAYKQIDPVIRQGIANTDLRRYLKARVKNNIHYDYLYANAFAYIPENDIGEVLDNCSKICSYMYLLVPYKGIDDCADPYRVLYKSKDWWSNTIKKHGFKSTKSKYVWRSTNEGSNN